jgi:hypothetical protein
MTAAAVAYAEAGWYVGPLAPGSKSPGSVLGAGWPTRTSQDPDILVAWFAGSDRGLFLHAGRSGAVIFDIDHAEHLPDELAEAVTTAPFQSTRPDTPGRGHAVFTQPAGRVLGNSPGSLGPGWGEVRGRNGVIVAFPTPHPDGGRYQWQRTGPVPGLPEAIASQIPDASNAATTASSAEVTAFVAAHTSAHRPSLLAAVVAKFRADLTGGRARHDAAVAATCWAMREAAAGFYPATVALDQLTHLYVTARAAARDGGRPPVSEATALAEMGRVTAWAVAQTDTVDPAQTRDRVNQRTGPLPLPDRPAHP